MRIEQLHYLVETSKFSSMNQASEWLNINQQRLNVALKNLEKEIGFSLLHRTSLGISLTEQGKIVVEYASKVVAYYQQMHEQIDDSDNMGNQESDVLEQLNMMSTPLFSHTLLPQVIDHLMNEYSQISVTSIGKEMLEIIQDIQAGKPALGFIVVQPKERVLLEQFEANQGVTFSVAEARLFVSVADDHPLAKQKSVMRKTILKYPMAIYQADDRMESQLLQNLSEVGVPNVQTITNNVEIYRASMCHEQNIGFTPVIVNKGESYLSDLDKRRLLAIRDFPNLEVMCIAHQSYYKANERAIKAFLETLAVCMSKPIKR